MFEGVRKYNKDQRYYIGSTYLCKDQVHLFTNDKFPPMAQKARRIPYKIREKVSNELEMLRKQDIINIKMNQHLGFHLL